MRRRLVSAPVALAALACGPRTAPAPATKAPGVAAIAPGCFADARLTLVLDTAMSTRRSGGAREARVIYADSVDALGTAPDFATFWTARGDSVDVAQTDGQMGMAWRLALRGDTLSGVETVFIDVPHPKPPSRPVRLVRIRCRR